jgi:hypothetical protein
LLGCLFYATRFIILVKVHEHSLVFLISCVVLVMGKAMRNMVRSKTTSHEEEMARWLKLLNNGVALL